MNVEGRCETAMIREKLPRREAGPPNHLHDKLDSDQEVVNKELSPSLTPNLPEARSRQALISLFFFITLEPRVE
jgi:hypothetical protein